MEWILNLAPSLGTTVAAMPKMITRAHSGSCSITGFHLPDCCEAMSQPQATEEFQHSNFEPKA